MPSRDVTEASARSDGNKLRLTTTHGRELTFDWDGRPGAHHATIVEQRTNYPFGSENVVEVSVYDAEGTLIGTINETDWS